MQGISIEIYDSYGCERTVCVSVCGLYEPRTDSKEPEGEQIAEFDLAFSEGERFGTDVTENSVSITYTRSTEIVNIEVKLIPDQSDAAISKVTDSDKPQTRRPINGVGSILWWIGGGILAVMLITLLAIILRKKKKEDRKEQI